MPTHLSKKTKAIIAAVLLIIIAAGVGLYLWQDSQKTRTTHSVYLNSAYNYWFAYQRTYDLVEYSSQNVAIGKKTPEGMKAEAEVTAFEVEEGITYSSFEEFAVAQGGLFCAADSPTLSLSCTGIDSIEPFTSSTALEGIVFYLTQETRSITTGEVTIARKGPFYAFDGSAVNRGPQYTAIIVRPPTAQVSDAVDEELLFDIANAFQFFEAETVQ